ncbi:hypothetical protein ABGB07_46100 [Micromonosporaceae bacterium B7E4]
MSLTIEDVKQMALELWLAQRENAALRAEVDELRHRLDQAVQPAPTVTEG